MKFFAVVWKSFRWPLSVLAAGVLVGGLTGGAEQALVVAVLAVLEISLSFDNAVINATVVKRLNNFWRKMFLTVGMVIAVFGMRLLFPILIVAVTAGLGFGDVINLILHHPHLYGAKLEAAHPTIAAFGGVFLLMIFLDFLFDDTKQIHWIAAIEKPLAKSGRIKTLSTLIAVVALLIVSATWAGEESGRVVVAGVTGLATYLVVHGFSRLFERFGGVGEAAGGGRPLRQLAGRAALFQFIYLEVLDASFSFDGVVGAFAITSNVLTIAIGLGVGAFFVRELTVWLVRHDTLSEFIYLEHGAHYAVGALAVLLGLSLRYNLPDLLTGLVGVAFIALAFGSSLRDKGARAAG